MNRLKAILEYKRPHGGEGERTMCEKFILPYSPTVVEHKSDGSILAYVVTVGAQETGAISGFSCHTDTVHYKDGKQVVEFDDEAGVAYKHDGECLGADDGAGIWLLLEMIDAGVPGRYFFHRGEERGGIGSKALAKQYPEYLRDLAFIAAFDRKARGSVISHQGFGGRCCSDDFAEELSRRLSAFDMEYAPDSGGIYTDTAEYTHLVGECTNISVGYENEHTSDEMLDLWFLQSLRVAALDPATWVALPKVREAGAEDPDDLWSYGGSSRYSALYVTPAMTSDDEARADDVMELLGSAGYRRVVDEFDAMDIFDAAYAYWNWHGEPADIPMWTLFGDFTCVVGEGNTPENDIIDALFEVEDMAELCGFGHTVHHREHQYEDAMEEFDATH